MKYLYGASVQGIQSFIFETNELSDIIGASEIVEYICTKAFKEFNNIDKDNIILSAAGNIRILVNDIKDIEQLVLKFPKYAQELAPGITISQAVVEITNELKKEDIITLEKKLKIQRNKINRFSFISALGIERSRKSGNSAICRLKNVLEDKSSILKKGKSNDTQLEKKIIHKDQKFTFPRNLSDITDKNSWIAVIHADGNDLGKTIQALPTNKGVKQSLSSFSKIIENSTLKAANTAFNEYIKPEVNNKKYYPFRPVIIGGDDLTVICRADIAIHFTKSFLENFEIETSKALLENFGTKNLKYKKITACAGIAFVKEKYPFHYAVTLAEELCSYAKKISKEKTKEHNLKTKENKLDYVIPSIMFHKTTSSFVNSFKEIQQRELMANASNVDFCFGPYAIENDLRIMSSIKYLYSCIYDCNLHDFPRSGLRKWLSLLHSNENTANQLWDRILQINKSYKNKLEKFYYDNESRQTIAYDVLSILSLTKGGS